MINNSQNGPATRFRTNIVELLEFVCSAVQDLIDEKLTIMNANAISIASNIVRGWSAVELINSFVGCHEDWRRIYEKDLKFISETVPETYKGIPFDVNIFIVPVKIYMDLRKAGNYKGAEDEEDWPINSDDIDTMWEFFHAMVGIACTYIHIGRRPQYLSNNAFTYTNPDYCKEIDLESYVEMFEVKLKNE